MRDITLCHPRLQKIADVWIKACATEGITVAISETLRTAAEQDALYAQGRTKPGNIVTNAKGSSYRSQHQWGIAFDFYLKMDVDGDGKIADDAYNDSKGHFRKAAEIGKKLGLAWGGDWSSIVDKPHLYLPDWGSTPTPLIKQYKTPEKFMKTWIMEPVKMGWQKENGGWRFYLKDGSENYVVNDWYKDGDLWYWFDGNGIMVHNVWYQYKGHWYYLDFFVLLDCFQVNDIPVNSFHNIVSSPTATLQYVLIWYTNGMHDRSSIVAQIVKTEVRNIQLLKLAPKLLCDLVRCKLYNAASFLPDPINDPCRHFYGPVASWCLWLL